MGSCYEGGAGDWPLLLPVNFALNTSISNPSPCSKEHTPGCAECWWLQTPVTIPVRKHVFPEWVGTYLSSDCSWNFPAHFDLLLLISAYRWPPLSVAHSWKGNLSRGWKYYTGWDKWNMIISSTPVMPQAAATSLPTASLAPQASCGFHIDSRVFLTLLISGLLPCASTPLTFHPVQ